MPRQSLDSVVLPIIVRDFDPQADTGDTVRRVVLSRAEPYNVWDPVEVEKMGEQAGAAFVAVRDGVKPLPGDTIKIAYRADYDGDESNRPLAAWVLRNGHVVGGYVPNN